MRIICNNGGFINLSQELIDSINVIKTNQSHEENCKNIECILFLIKESTLSKTEKEDCIFFIDSIKEFTSAI